MVAIVESITKGSTDKPSSALLEDVKGEIVIKEETKTPKANVHPFVQRMSDDLKALAK